MACVLVLIATGSHAAGVRAPVGFSRFHETCPAQELLPQLDVAEERCQHGDATACDDFVKLFRELVPTYDCQRSFDQDYFVPAIWLAGGPALDRHVRVLAGLKTRAAQEFFASAAFRSILDGYLAEEFKAHSLRAEQDRAARPPH